MTDLSISRTVSRHILLTGACMFGGLIATPSLAADTVCGAGYITKIGSLASELPNIVVTTHDENSTPPERTAIIWRNGSFSEALSLAHLQDREALLRAAFLAHLPVRIVNPFNTSCQRHGNELTVSVCSGSSRCE